MRPKSQILKSLARHFQSRQAKLRHGFIHYGLITVHGQQDLKFGVVNHYVCDEMNVCYPRNPISLACQFEDCCS